MRRHEDLTPRHQAMLPFREDHRTRRVRHDHSKFRKVPAGEYDFDATYCPACNADRDAISATMVQRRWDAPSAAEYRERHLPDVPNAFVAQFLAGPVDVERAQMRDQCRLSDAKAIKRAEKFLTLASEYAARRRPNPLHEPLPTYADWLVRVCHLSRKDAVALAAKQNADCRALRRAERKAELADSMIVNRTITTEATELRAAA